MKKHCLILLFLSLLMTFTAHAGSQFVPKAYSYEKVGSDANESFYVYFYNLFEYPDNITTKTDISQMEGITITTSSGDDSIIRLNAISAHMNQTRMQLTRLGGVKGETTFSVSITYNGETVTNEFPVNIYGIATSEMSKYLDPDNLTSETFDVIANTKFYTDAEKTTCTLTLDNADELQHGTVELVDGANGYKEIKYTPTSTPKGLTAEAIKYTISLSDGSEASSSKVMVYITKSCYATKILEYQPAAGQFRTETAWDNPLEFFESENRGLSLGALGGYVVFGFDQPIYNNPQNPYGVDFTVEGNSFVAAEKGVWTEPGAVQVMEDKNGNGLPDDGEWYELAGSDYWLSTTKHNVEVTYYNPSYNNRYTVPWSMKWEENGKTNYEYGAVVSNNFHKHTFYPDYFYNQDNPNESMRWYNPSVSRDSITFSGISQIRGCIDMRAPTYIEFYAYSGFGYCDNKGFVKEDSRIAQNPYGRPSLGETAGDGMDISWAVDKDGNYVELEKIDFVKVYTAGQVIAGWLGEWSTEALNCAMTLPDPTYVPKDYYYNYAGITQLQVPKGHTCQYEGFLFKNGRPVTEATQNWWLTMDQEGLITEGVDAIAEINDNGLFTAKGIGKVWVHFSAKEDIPEEIFEVSVCDLTAVVISLEGNTGPVSDNLSCVVGERVYINVESEDTSTDSYNESTENRFIYDTYTWHNSNPEVGSIHNGNFIAHKPGVTTLTAVSNINPRLYDKIDVTVIDVPEIKTLPIQIAETAPQGELLNSQIFSTGNEATVYMEEVATTKGNVTVSLFNNHLSYEFTEGEYCTDILRFKVTYYGNKREIEVPITYGPNNLATRKKLLMINSIDESGNDLGIAQLQGIDAETNEIKTFVDNLPQSYDVNQVPMGSLLPDGAYAYMAQGTSLARYDVEYGKLVAITTLTSANKHQLATYKDKLIVSDGNTLKLYYRTDLECFKSLEMNGEIKQLTIKDDAAYILCTTDEGANINKLNLSTFALTDTNIALDGGEKASGMYYINNNLYIATGETDAGAASIVVFNPTDNTSTVTTAPLEGILSIPHNSSTLVGNTILVSRGVGFISYNIESGTFEEETILTAGDMIPLNIVGETIESDENTINRYYVTYNQGMAIFESDEPTQPKNTFVAVPSAISIMSATEENEAPTVKKAYSVSSGIYENSTSVKSCTAAKLSNCFTDKEGNTVDNYAMYIREDVDWLDLTYDASSGQITPKVKYTGLVDEKTDMVFTLECIDKYGASVKSTATFTITPRVYKPTITENELNLIASPEEEVSNSRAISEIFSYSSTSGCSSTTEVTNVSDNTIISKAEIVDDRLVVTIPAQAKGTASVEITQTTTHKSSKTTKTFTANIPVIVDFDSTSEIQDIVISDTRIYYTDGILTVENCSGEEVIIYDIAGHIISSFTAIEEIHSTQINLVNGVYIVKVGNLSVKIAVK